MAPLRTQRAQHSRQRSLNDRINPVGTPVPLQIQAADEALTQSTLEPPRGLIEEERWTEFERRLHTRCP